MRRHWALWAFVFVALLGAILAFVAGHRDEGVWAILAGLWCIEVIRLRKRVER